MSSAVRTAKAAAEGTRPPAARARPAEGHAPQAAVQRVVAQAGRPLPAMLRRQVEARFGHDFSQVRIHTDTEAARSAEAEDAEAYTVANHIVFGAGRYAPEHAEGRRLLAHELAHVVQQGRGAAAGLHAPSQPAAGTEAQADAAAAAVLQPAAPGAAPVAVAGVAAPGVAHRKKRRKPGETDDDAFEDEARARRDERRGDRSNEKQRAQQRDAARQDARGGLQGTAAKADAQRKAYQAVDDAKAGAHAHASPDANLKRLRRLKKWLRESDLPVRERIKLQQELDEAQRTPRSNRVGKPQQKYAGGMPEAGGLDLPTGKSRYTQPDFSQMSRKDDGTQERAHVNLKSDYLDDTRLVTTGKRLSVKDMSAADRRQKARAYVKQALKAARHLPGQDPTILHFAEPGTEESRKDICDEVFKKNNGIKEVRFHTRAIRREAWQAEAAREADAKKKAREADKARKAQQEAADKQARKEQREADRRKAREDKQKKRGEEKAERAKQRADQKAKRDAEKQQQKETKQKEREAKKAERERKKEEEKKAREARKADTARKKEAERQAREAKKAEDAKQKAPRRAAQPAAAKPKAASRASGKAAPAGTASKSAGTRRKAKAATPQDDASSMTVPRQARPRRNAPKPAGGAERKQQPKQQPGPQTRKAAPRPPTRTPAKPAAASAAVKPSATKPAGKPAPRQASKSAGTAPPQAPQHVPRQAPDKAGGKPAQKQPSRQPAKTPAKAAPVTSMQVERGASLIGGPGKLGAGAHAGVQSHTDFGKGRSTTTTAGFGGKATVSVSEVPYSNPRRYRVEFHVHLGGQAGGSATQEGRHGSSVSAGASASAALDLTVAHELSAEDKDRYLAQVQAGSTGAWRELEVAQLAASGSLARARELANQMRGRMKDGDEVTLSASAGVEGNLGASAGEGLKAGVSVGAGQSSGIERSDVVRGGKHYVSFRRTDTDSDSLGASGGYGVAEMGIARQRRRSRGEAVSFIIDTADAGRHDALLARVNAAAGSMDALRKLRDDEPELHGTKTQSRGRGGDLTTSAGVGGLGIDFIDQGEFNEDVSEGPDGVSRVYTAEGTGGARFRVGKRTIAGASESSAFTGGAGPDNVGWGETRSVRRQTDYSATARKLAEGMSTAPIGTVLGVFRGETPVVQETVQQHGAAMSDESYAAVIALARNKAQWQKSWDGSSMDTYLAWDRVRLQVLAAGEDRQRIARLIAEFEEQHARGASDTVQKAIGGTGVEFEFPPSVADQKPLYDALVVGDPLANAQAAGDAGQQVAHMREDLDKLAGMDRKIADHAADFQRPVDFIGMRQRIAQRQSALRAAIAKLQPRPGAAPAAAQAAVTTVPTADEVAAQEADQAAERQREIDGVTDRLRSYRGTEQQVFAAMEQEFKGYVVLGHEMPKLSMPDVKTLTDAQNKLKAAYPAWGKDIALLRRLLTESGGDPSKADAYRPNRARYLELDRQIPYHGAGSGLPGYEEI